MNEIELPPLPLADLGGVTNESGVAHAVREYAKGAVELHRKNIEKLLQDPIHVHRNMCRGIIAPITFGQLAHILGDQATQEWLAERDPRSHAPAQPAASAEPVQLAWRVVDRETGAPRTDWIDGAGGDQNDEPPFSGGLVQRAFAAPIAAQPSVPAYPTDEWVQSFFGCADENGFYHFRGDFGNVADAYRRAMHIAASTPPADGEALPFGLKPSDFPPLPECCDTGPRCGNPICEQTGGQAQQEADKVDADPSDSEIMTIMIRWAGGNGTDDEGIAALRALFHFKSTQTDPAMAGDEISDDELLQLIRSTGFRYDDALPATTTVWKDGIDIDVPAAWVCRLAKTLSARKRVQLASVSISDDLLRFLHGSGEIDGVWFGDKHPKYPGRFWWRALLPQPGSVRAASGEDARDAALLRAMAAEWDRAECSTDPQMPIWYALCEALDKDSDGNGMRAAIEAAMQQGGQP